MFRGLGLSLAVGLLIACSALPGGSARAESQRQTYDVTVAGLTVSRMEFGVNTSGAAYSARAVVRSAGLVAAFVKFEFDGTAEGRFRADGSLEPVRFRAVREANNTTQRIGIDYARGVPRGVTVDPPRSPAPHNLDPTAQTGTIDPVSATLLFLTEQPVGESCGRSARIYDGARLFSLQVEPRRASGALWACPGRYTRLGGFPPDMMAERTVFPFTLYYEEVDGMMRPKRVEVTTTFGTAVGRRTR